MLPEVAKAITELRHAQLDSGFDGADWLIQPCRNLTVRQPFIICELEGLLLGGRKDRHRAADRHPKFLIGLGLKGAWTQIRYT